MNTVKSVKEPSQFVLFKQIGVAHIFLLLYLPLEKISQTIRVTRIICKYL